MYVAMHHHHWKDTFAFSYINNFCVLFLIKFPINHECAPSLRVKIIFPLMYKILITFCGQQKTVQPNLTTNTSSYQWWMCQLMAENCKFNLHFWLLPMNIEHSHKTTDSGDFAIQLHDNLFKDSLHSWICVAFITSASGYEIRLEARLEHFQLAQKFYTTTPWRQFLETFHKIFLLLQWIFFCLYSHKITRGAIKVCQPERYSCSWFL